MRDGVVESPPYGDRSSVGVTPEGALDVRRVEFFGTWRGLGQRRTVNDMNQPPGPNGSRSSRPSYGPATPPCRRRPRSSSPRFRRRRRTPTCRPGGPGRRRGRRRSRGTAPCSSRAARRRSGSPRRRRSARRSTMRVISGRSGRGSSTRSAAARCSSGTAARSSARTRRSRLPARAAQPAHGGRPARRRPHAARRHRRSPARVQRGHDELRARTDARPARRGHRLRASTPAARRRSPSTGSCSTGRPTPAASARLDVAPAHVLRRLLAGTRARHLAERRRRRRDAARTLLQDRAPVDVTATLTAPDGDGRVHRDLAARAGHVPGRIPACLARSAAASGRACRGQLAPRGQRPPTISAATSTASQTFTVNSTLGFTKLSRRGDRRPRARAADDPGGGHARPRPRASPPRSRPTSRRQGRDDRRAARSRGPLPRHLERHDARRTRLRLRRPLRRALPRDERARLGRADDDAVPRHPGRAAAEEATRSRVESPAVPAASILSRDHRRRHRASATTASTPCSS